MSDPLLSTKLYYPRLRSGLVARPRLIEKLNNGLEGRVTLLSAPAGFGKTTLLAEWIAGQQGETAACRTAWLSLDSQDNDLSRFWNYLTAALQQANPDIGRSAITRLQSSQPFQSEAVLTLLINDLAQVSGKLCLFLDDYHLISNPAIHTAMVFLLDHAPPQFHLVVAGRSDPPLALSHWRVQGEMNELRATNLRFTADETNQFFQQLLQQPLSAETLDMLSRRTEGWPAGLQLAALSLRGLDSAETAEFVTHFNGSNRHVVAYLVEEVFQRQPPLVQHFLLQTTLLDRLSAALCDAVTDIESWDAAWELPDTAPPDPHSSQTILDYLSGHNLFLIPLDETGRWFRYHTLFAETIQLRLRETAPDLVKKLHYRAGVWYAANGFSEQAVRHALAAEAYDYAAELVERIAGDLWPRGHLSQLLGWLSALPDEIFSRQLNLCLLHAWLLFLHDRWAEASGRVHLAGQQLAALPQEAAETRRYHGRWAAIQGAMTAQRHEAAAAIAWMETALEYLPQDDVHWRQVAMIGLGLAQLAEGEAAPAMTTLHRAALTCEEVDDLYLAFAAWWHQYEACWAQGHLREAAVCLRRLERLAERDEGDWLALRENAAVGWGMLAYERNELEKAEQQIKAALPKIWPGGQPRVVLMAYLTLARLALARSRLDEAGDHLRTAEQLAHRFHLTAEQPLITAVTVQLYLAGGQLSEAYWQLEDLGLGPESAAEFRHEKGLLMLARLYLADGRVGETAAFLGRLQAAAELAGRDGSLVEICLLQALALTRLQQPDSAHAFLNRALKLAEPEQYGRLFINEGRAAARLLDQVEPTTTYIEWLLAQMEQNPAAAQLADPLTERELEILTLVAEGAGNQTIADRLFISLGTVKGHLNHILSKLEAHNRTEAVARGREFGLLP